MTRCWPAGLPIAVTHDDLGTPRRLVLADQEHRVDQLVTRWRVKQRWWRQCVWRDYFVVVTHRHLLITVFHELPQGGWFLQYLYD